MARGREAARRPGGSALAVGGGSRVAEETARGCPLTGTGRGLQPCRGFLRASPASGVSLPLDASPFLLHLLVHSVLLTSWPLVSGGFSLPVEAFILEPPPLPLRTPPIEAVLALRTLLPGTWRMPTACRVSALWGKPLK